MMTDAEAMFSLLSIYLHHSDLDRLRRIIAQIICAIQLVPARVETENPSYFPELPP